MKKNTERKTIIKAENLSVFYKLSGKVNHAVKNINFSVKEGEVLGIVGESGSGKSTIARTLMGINDYHKGSIFVGKYRLPYNFHKIKKSDRGYLAKTGQMVFQDSKNSLNSLKTIRKVILEGINNFDPLDQEWLEKVNSSKSELKTLQRKIKENNLEKIIAKESKKNYLNFLYKNSEEYREKIDELEYFNKNLKDLKGLISLNRNIKNSDITTFRRSYSSFRGALLKSKKEELREIRLLKNEISETEIQEFDAKNNKEVTKFFNSFFDEFSKDLLKTLESYDEKANFKKIITKIESRIYVEEKILISKEEISKEISNFRTKKRDDDNLNSKLLVLLDKLDSNLFDCAEKLQVKAWMKNETIEYLFNELNRTYDKFIDIKTVFIRDAKEHVEFINSKSNAYTKVSNLLVDSRDSLIKEAEYDIQIAKEYIKYLKQAKSELKIFYEHHNESNLRDIYKLIKRDFLKLRKIDESISIDYWNLLHTKYKKEMILLKQKLKNKELWVKEFVLVNKLSNNTELAVKYKKNLEESGFENNIKKDLENNKNRIIELENDIESLKKLKPTKDQKNKNKDEILKRIIKIVGFDETVLDRYPSQLSGGQLQRIAIARALVMSPEFIIADEPISALDVSIQAQVINLLNKLRKEIGLTILFIAHDLRVVEYISDYVVVIFKGRIVEKGKSELVFNNPIHPYTKTLINSVPEIFELTSEKNKRFNESVNFYTQTDYNRYSKICFYEVEKGHYFLATESEKEMWFPKAKKEIEKND